MVAKNHCLMQLRNKSGKATVSIPDKLWIQEEDEPDKQLLFQNEKTLSLMSAALKELSPEQQQCITLFYLEKKSYAEISMETGYNMMQVKSYIQNGKRNLRILLEKKLSQPE